MKKIFEPKLTMSVTAVPPDSFESLDYQSPCPDFVVSRNLDGSIASIYGDLIWDYTAYEPSTRPSVLNFIFWKTGKITNRRIQLTLETRYIIFSLIWLRSGNPLSNGTLRNYTIVVNELARYSEIKNITICNLLAEEKSLWDFVNSQKSGWLVETFTSMIKMLANTIEIDKRMKVVSGKILRLLRQRGIQYRRTLNQHAPIPTRIYSEFIARLKTEIINWKKIEEQMLLAIETCSENRSQRKKDKFGNQKYTPISQLINQVCLDYLFENDLDCNVKSLSKIITEMQLVSKLTIQVFSGMRDNEAFTLPYDCLEESYANGIKHFFIRGNTTKFNNGRQVQTRWVTNLDGADAIKIAQRIALTIYKKLGIDPTGQSQKKNEIPLFISAGHLPLATLSPKRKNGQLQPTKIAFSRLSALREKLIPKIQESDILELEEIDQHRSWRSEEKFQIGILWHFCSHQLRRSLALYAQRSGLVSLSSLRRQLQHITNEMSQYYAKGSAFAKDLIGDDKDHFGLVWQRTQPESAGLSYIKNVLLSEEMLVGGHASWVKNQNMKSNAVLAVDRDLTMLRFKKGEMAYTETIVGGCTNIDACKHPALDWLNFECLASNCKNLVCDPRKLDRVISAHKKFLISLDPNTVEYRTEKSNLEALQKMYAITQTP
ncbi:hypothetical protein UNDKW_4051 [Undibacterium sp. KW1]|uniref:integrase n=1 Tax=Undibacterium sp. KW1 TaxID=2058624 RepID=UPI001331DF8D|nr:integrase [Undibacterium sp. KW1]BBB62324.1 hypothetical protein UNDKW_4051 [Undibacterium sp. KW1]